MTQLQARPGINGNSRDDFIDAYMALTDAREALDAALRMLGGNVTNGRNYQHLSPDRANEARIADQTRTLDVIRGASEEMESLQSDIADILETS